MSMLLTMEILRVATLLSLFCFYSVCCFPSRPLNERSTQLAWQAWLLVDDQNQNKQYDSESFPRRRITPKSVFIAPTFSPESLPACAEGYRPDSMGRCIKIIKLDEEAHLDFLLEKLNAQFGNYDEVDDEQEEAPTPGPFQLNIPLNGAAEESPKNADDSLDIAIVVAPTNGNFALEDGVKATVKRTNFPGGDSQTQDKPSPVNANPPPPPSTSASPQLETESKIPVTEAVQETTLASEEETTTLLDTGTLTTTEEADEDTTSPFLSTVFEETTTQGVEADTTISDQHALFFLEPSLTNTKHVQNGTNNAQGTPAVSNDSLTTLLSNSTLADSSAHPDKRPDASQEPSDLMTSENLHQSASLVRFPTPEEEGVHRIDYVKHPEQISQSQLLPHISNTYASQFHHGQILPPPAPKRPISQQFDSLFNEYIHSRGADLKGNERFVFKNHGSTFSESIRPVQHGPEHAGPADRFQANGGFERVFNHRNRDKVWSLPPSWSESSPQKPIVLRFSRRSSNGRHLLEEHLRPHTQNSQTFYREVPTEDFSYIFGVNSNHNRRRNRR